MLRPARRRARQDQTHHIHPAVGCGPGDTTSDPVVVCGCPEGSPGAGGFTLAPCGTPPMTVMGWETTMPGDETEAGMFRDGDAIDSPYRAVAGHRDVRELSRHLLPAGAGPAPDVFARVHAPHVLRVAHRDLGQAARPLLPGGTGPAIDPPLFTHQI
jgi:hypothetical protein